MSAQEYHNTPVSISGEKVRNNGKLYYSHIVLEKQTLFSIAKAYGVTMDEIYEANPTLNLKADGPKINQIILIPVKAEGIPQATEEQNGNESVAEAGQVEKADTTKAKKNIFTSIANAVRNTGKDNSASKDESNKSGNGDGYTIHTVRWYEDLESIADKYKIDKESIIAFNGLSSPKVEKGMKLKIPDSPQITAAVPATADSEEVPSVDKDISGYVIAETAGQEPIVEKKHIKAALLLPLNAGTDKVNDSNYDFYAGALLALKDLGDTGLNVDLSVYDIARNNVLSTKEIYSSNDLILGPISLENIHDALDACPEDKFIISPLDPKTASLAHGTANFIQAPSSAEVQYNDLVQWIKEDKKPEDKLIVISEKNMTPSPLADIIAKSGLEYESVNYGILEGRDITELLSRIMSTSAANRVVVTSESEAFINDVVRNLNIMVFRKYDVVLYGPSRIRNYETIEVENYHNTKLHVTSSYFIDYDNNRVKRFLMAYRALYGAEPTPFAYQGYDTVYYFIQKCSKGGRDWAETLVIDKFKGLQSDFLFHKVPDGGYYNKAIRRIIYEGDYSIMMVN